MKHVATLLLCFTILIISTATAQTIRRVNNTQGLTDPNVYATAQAAHNAANTNDIISLEPSDNPSYGNLTVTKRVTIVGPGYFLDKNPNTSFDKRTPTLDRITFENGSANSSITGVYLNGSGGTGLLITDVNIAVTRCRTGGILFGRSTNLLAGVYSYGNTAQINDNFIEGSVSGNYDGTSFTSGSGCAFTNNIIVGGYSTLSNLGGCSINYNTIWGNIAAGVLVTVKSSTFSNNIIDARLEATGYSVLGNGSTGNTVSNNVCLSVNGLPTGSGNVNGVNPSLVFINSGNPFATYTNNGDTDFQLSASSPARTAGTSGGQTGAFGGTTPYVLSGVPAYPVITSFTNSGSGNSSTPLTVTISVRSNN